MERNNIIKNASIISISGNALLALAKIIVGLTSGSLSVLGDGLDSITDVIISIITLAVSIIIMHPPDKEHPYGHFRAETIGTSILAFIIFFVGGQLGLSTIGKLLDHDHIGMPGKTAIYVTIASILGKTVLSLSQYILGKRAGSPLILANARNMLNDIVISGGVLAGLAFVFIYDLAIIDRIVAIIISVWIMYTAVRIFAGTITEMMEGEVNMELYNKIIEAVKATEGVSNPHRIRIRKIGFHHVVDMDVEVDGDSSVTEAHDRVVVLENKIRDSIQSLYDVVIHMEPLGNFEKNECWGLREKDYR